MGEKPLRAQHTKNISDGLYKPEISPVLFATLLALSKFQHKNNQKEKSNTSTHI